MSRSRQDRGTDLAADHRVLAVGADHHPCTHPLTVSTHDPIDLVAATGYTGYPYSFTDLGTTGLGMVT